MVLEEKQIWTFPTGEFIQYGDDNRWDTGKSLEKMAIDVELHSKYNGGVFIFIEIYCYSSGRKSNLELRSVQDYELPEYSERLSQIYTKQICGRYANKILCEILIGVVFNNPNYEKYFPKMYQQFKDIPNIVVKND